MASLLDLKDSYEESLENAKESLSNLQNTLDEKSEFSEEEIEEICEDVKYFMEQLEDFNLNMNGLEEVLNEKVENDDLVTMANYCSDYYDKANDILDKTNEAINSVYNLNEHHSDFDKNKIAINVKLYSQEAPTLKEIKNALIEKGYEVEDVEENVTDELISDYVQTYNEDSWSSFDDIEAKGFEFVGSTGRMDGYAVFKVTASSIEEFDEFSKEIESLHKGVLNGLSIEDITSRIIEDEIVLTKKEQEALKKEEEFEKNRPYKETTTPLNEFSLKCNEMKVTFWDNDKGFIKSADVHFEKENLTLKDIVNNLKDDYFGVMSIDGGENIEVYQFFNVEKTYLDNNQKVYSKIKEEAFFGDIDKKDNNLDDLVEIKTEVEVNNYDNSFLNKMMDDFAKTGSDIEDASKQVDSKKTTNKNKNR